MAEATALKGIPSTIKDPALQSTYEHLVRNYRYRGVPKTAEAIPPQELGGLLNSTLSESRRKQQDKVAYAPAWQRNANEYYANVDAGHGLAHIKAVVHNARTLAKTHYPEAPHVVSRAAYLHDIGNSVDRGQHEIHGAEIAQNNPKLLAGLSKVQREQVLDAIRNHRASTGKPVHVISKIVSDADRMSDMRLTPSQSTNVSLMRGVDYGRHHMPELTDAQQVQRAMQHMKDKYVDTKGTASRLYFPETAAIRADRDKDMAQVVNLPHEEVMARLGINKETAAFLDGYMGKTSSDPAARQKFLMWLMSQKGNPKAAQKYFEGVVKEAPVQWSKGTIQPGWMEKRIQQDMMRPEAVQGLRWLVRGHKELPAAYSAEKMDNPYSRFNLKNRVGYTQAVDKVLPAILQAINKKPGYYKKMSSVMQGKKPIVMAGDVGLKGKPVPAAK